MIEINIRYADTLIVINEEYYDVKQAMEILVDLAHAVVEVSEFIKAKR